jgi:glutamate formiminotransferase/formiminotetrahydrofolate cyclodeaminase
MVAGISLEKAPAPDERGDDVGLWADVERVHDAARELGTRFAKLEGDDIAAFEGFLAALRLPKTSDDEKERRRAALADATVSATETPLETLVASLEVLDMVRDLLDLARSVRLRAEADLGGAVELAHAAFRGAELNVRVNLPGLKNDARAAQLEQRWSELSARLGAQYDELRVRVASWLAGQ